MRGVVALNTVIRFAPAAFASGDALGVCRASWRYTHYVFHLHWRVATLAVFAGGVVVLTLSMPANRPSSGVGW